MEDNELTQKESMRRLNGARVGLKHHGTLPSKLDIEAFRATATSFFEENTPTVFHVNFATISLIELIQCVDTRNNLAQAEELLKDGKIEDSLDRIAVAFNELIDDYERRKTGRFGRSPFFFGDSMTFLDSFFMGLGHGHRGIAGVTSETEDKLAQFIDRVKESIEALQDAVKILSLGIDYRRYVKFRLLTPSILRTIGGGYHIARAQRGARGMPTADDVQFCIDFVIESAITLQAFDFSLE